MPLANVLDAVAGAIEHVIGDPCTIAAANASIATGSVT
jgi:hypothetical protein